ncbi:hypothetical protein GCM10011506_43530 [Marivirga lumbricoides]|uniref:Lipocalin-like domain-containing protein n=2 Tax=Marivirga lumbricoides TaxID=1046115 RepID=A0ABQ1N3W7_9BACT|nr:hypothetical protein GCM10011506_43530 [Marivirga lumbricoides]
MGKWKCSGYEENDKEIKDFNSFELTFKQATIICSPRGNKLWPAKCQYESIGSINGGYYFREDGCFFQVKNMMENNITIELNLRITEEGSINKYIFYLKKENN